MFTHALKTLNELLISEILKKIRVISVKTDIINKDLIIIKITIINNIKALKISTIIIKYVNIRF